MMAARDEILQSIRRRLPEATPLAELEGPWIEYSDPVQQFCNVLEQIGGRAIRVAHNSEIASRLKEFPEFASAKNIVCPIPNLLENTIDLNSIDDPHQLENVDFAILRGDFGVAENGAVWIHDQDLKHRVIYFLCQHLALVIDRNNLVHNMSQAYQRLSFSAAGFGGFIAGPSKTADIEQSLVIGAHGPRSMTIFLVG